MAEQAGIEHPINTIDQETLLNSRGRALDAVGEYALARNDAAAIDQQAQALKAIEASKRQSASASFNQYELDIIAAVETGIYTGRDVVSLFVDYESIQNAILFRNELPAEQADIVLRQFDAMQPGALVAVPAYQYGSEEHFDYHIVQLVDTPVPVITQESSRLVLNYKFNVDNQGTFATRGADQVIVGKDAITHSLEKAAAKYLELCSRSPRDWHVSSVDTIMNGRNKMITLAEELGKPELAQELRTAKTKVALELFDNNGYDYDHTQSEYSNAARHLLTRSPKDFYQVLGNTIIDTEDILRRVRVSEYKMFAALHFAHLPEEATRYSFTEKEYLEAAAWFAKQHDLLLEAEANEREKGEVAWLASQQDSSETPEA